ncbi:lytic murein transglycosylase [Aquincola sp. J276]|uniref:lytic murein transglycosylase n=1 Tax=Aquincola sp. J276 TaxID=2898432 RepID=UPI00215080BD|nr:lytic murein transglycosylase [Aquincola sp. J276]MCR5867833.1 lytic murein transglycosylase [Aquincola sp. J276]
MHPYLLSTAWRAALVGAALAGCATAPGPAPSAPPAASPPPAAEAATEPAAAAAAAHQAAFARWVAGFRASAATAGIGEATLAAALDPVQYLPQVVQLDRAQPEFSRPVWTYLDNTVTPQRIAQGREKLAALQAELQAAEQRHGVPPSVVVAIWGMESNYGGNYGSTPTLDALATLGFEGRRQAWAREQLLAALRIVQNGDIDREHMVGSWAGAMGQTQFLPTSFLTHAVDADGDGRRDIWGSMADVVASTAQYLARSGWQAGQPSAVEVQLPPGFDLARADGLLRQPASAWAAEGVQGLQGAPLPALDDAALLLPAGARGPALLVGPNFRAILRYNNATSYALAVGLLARQIDGGPPLQAAWPRELQPLSRTELRQLQAALAERGFDAGTPDGVLGPATREALRRWQRSVGLPADGYPDAGLLQRLLQR